MSTPIVILSIVSAIIFIVLAIVLIYFLMKSIGTLKDTSRKLEFFTSESVKFFGNIVKESSEMKQEVVASLTSVDKVLISVNTNTKDITEIKDKVVVSLTEFDSLTDSLHKTTDNLSEIKTGVVNSLVLLDETTHQIVNSTKHIEDKLESTFTILEPFRILIGMVIDKFMDPVLLGSSLFSAFSKAGSAFMGRYKKH